MRSIGKLWQEGADDGARTVLRYLCVGMLVPAIACEAPPHAQAVPAEDSGLASLQPPPVGWKRVQFSDAFSFDAPADTEYMPLQGIDSRVGAYRSSHLDLTFDYGAYSNSLSAETPWTKIDGYPARLEMTGSCELSPGDKRPWLAGAVHVVISPPPENMSLTMTGCAADEAALEELRRLYLSLRFNPKKAR